MPMIRIAITAAAFEAIYATLPLAMRQPCEGYSDFWASTRTAR
jgi:hypothetical protein